MKYVISGGTGFIGNALIRALSDDACEITVLTRSERPERTLERARIRYAAWDGRSQGAWSREMHTADVVINLAGKNLFAGRWTKRVKRELTASRIDAVRALVRAMKENESKPSVFISVSAVGYYGDTAERDVSEQSPAGNDFLSHLTREWEAAAAEASLSGIRTAIPRMGIVLQKSGGALQKMALPFYLFAGGYVGSGRQWVSWIHMDDLIRALVYPVRHDTLSGPYNCTSPHPVAMKELCKAIGRALGRSCWTNVPSFAVKAVLGEASEMLLTGQRALPVRLAAEGFQFQYENVDDALQNIYR
jgi:uncharacterized protein